MVIGPNGAGKTTLLDVICRKTKPARGRVFFGKDVGLKGKREDEIVALGIERKFQAPSIYGNLAVWENLDWSLKRSSDGVLFTLLGKSMVEERARIAESLETIGLKEYAHTRAGWVSHSQKQRLEIGMVILQNPLLLLVDERVIGMTDTETEQTGRLLQSLAEKQAIVVIEHDMDFVRQIAHVVTVLHEGTVICEGTVEEVQATEATPCSSLKTINAYYCESPILRDVSFTIDPGEVVCLMGCNGVDKTTTLKVLTGLLPARSGRLMFDGADVTKEPTDQRRRRGLASVPQGREILPHLTVRENLLLGFWARSD